eukprot:jgi/Chrzof1/13192/Cz07g23160.t1
MFNAYRPGDVIAYQRLPWQEPDAPCHLDIVYEDEHLGIIEVPIGKVCYHGVAGGLFAASAAGKHAQSSYKVLHYHADRDCSLVQVTIFTGRPHQIRIHMAAIGHPLYGDPLYGVGGTPKEECTSSVAELGVQSTRSSSCPYILPGDCGYHLHCCSLTLPHPATSHDMTFTVPAPPELQAPHKAA